jgi:hypothetical protein
MGNASQSKATVPSASWNSSRTRKTSSGVAQRAGTTSTKPAFRNGPLRQTTRESAAFIGMVALSPTLYSQTNELPSRSPWQNQDTDGKVDVTLEQLVAQGRVGEDGYINVASQMGLSGERGTQPSL